MSQPTPKYQPGQNVIVTQQIAQRDEVWTSRIVGTVVKVEQQKTGSWYAHAKDDKLWLDRLTLRKADGEIVVINMDPYTNVQVQPEVRKPAESAAPAAETAEAEEASAE